MTRSELEKTIQAFFDEDARGADCVYLFGSRARGTERAGSDVDIAILFAEDPAPGFDGLPLRLEADLERRLGLPVQVVTLNGAPADLVHRVLRDGILLRDRDPSHRIRFETRRRNEFFDLQPILHEYRQPRPRNPA